MIELSASRCSQARACPPSIRTDGIQVVTGDLPAAGQALHHYMMCAIGYSQHMETSTVAAMFRADPEEVERLCQQTWRTWTSIRHWLGDRPQCEAFLEHQFGPIKLSGHIDVLGFAPADRQIRILDWKSAWHEEDASDQLRAYAWLALTEYEEFEENQEYDEVWAAVIRPRQGTYDAQVYRREELNRWMDGLIDRLTGRGSEEYHPGTQCMRCPHGPACGAKTLVLTQATQALLGSEHKLLVKSPDLLALALDRIRLVEKACEDVRTLIKAEVYAQGGKLPVGDGRELVVTEEARETIRWTQESQAIMVDEALAEDWPTILAIKKTELKKAVMDLAERGQKTAAWEGLQDRLREAGAVETTYIQKLELRRSHEGTRDSETLVAGGGGEGSGADLRNDSSDSLRGGPRLGSDDQFRGPPA